MDIVSVPEDSGYNNPYGKIRSCSYIPISLIEWGKDGHPMIPDFSEYEVKYTAHLLNAIREDIENSELEDYAPTSLIYREVDFIKPNIYSNIENLESIRRGRNINLYSKQITYGEEK